MGEKQAEPLTRPKFSASREAVSNSVSAALLESGLGLEDKNEIGTTALVVIDRLECWSKSIRRDISTKKRP